MKFTQSNMSPKIAGSLSTVTVSPYYFVDVKNGNDTNDGTTRTTAFKSLSRLMLELNKKVHNYTHVTIMEGVYSEGLSIYDCSGNIFITGEGDVQITGLSRPGISTGVYASIYIANCSASISINNIKFNHTDVAEDEKSKTQFVLFSTNVSSIMFHGCDIDTLTTQGKLDVHSPIALYGKQNTNITYYGGQIKNCGIAAYANVGGSVTTNNTVFENIADGYASLYGGIVNIVDYTGAPKLPMARNGRSRSLDVIEQGAIIETGTNANGTYYKYANGLLICTHILDAGTILTQTSVNGLYNSDVVQWDYPHLFHLYAPVISGLPTQGAGMSWISLSEHASTSVNCRLKVIRIGQSSLNESVSLVATGRWK